ncbi:hypothetical protein BJY04DRAFT_183774 [Aspergillus karnatakaensis]|uniref:uncharacterized protein n=1 Tax=Aspergillus karnatakaensis TaxID=1810916 RepID=UPI003CCC9B4F
MEGDIATPDRNNNGNEAHSDILLVCLLEIQLWGFYENRSPEFLPSILQLSIFNFQYVYLLGDTTNRVWGVTACYAMTLILVRHWVYSLLGFRSWSSALDVALASFRSQ